MQTDLFGNIVIEEEKETDQSKTLWSSSRIAFLNSCPRKYYYKYFGSRKTVAHDESNKERLLFLENLSNRYLIQGTAIHEAIERYFLNYKDNNIWTLDKLKWYSFKKLQDCIDHSLTVTCTGNSNTIQPYKILKEIYYSTLSEKQLREDIKTKMEKSLDNFFKSETFEKLLIGGKTTNSLIEQRIRFDLTKKITIIGKLDLSFNNDNEKYIVADWKTGDIEHEETSLQLLAYANWCIEQKKASIDDIYIQKAYLLENSLEDLKFNNKNLLRAKIRIIQDCQSFLELEPHGKKARREAFSKCNQPKICSLCPYEEICFQSKFNSNGN